MSPEEQIAQCVASIGAGETEVSRQHISTLIEQHPHNSTGYYLMANWNAEQGKIQDALSHFEHCIELSPHFPIARLQYGLLLTSLERENDALEQLQAIDNAGDIGCFATGLIALINQDFSEAAHAIEQGLNLPHDNPALHQNMRDILGRLSSLDDKEPTENSEADHNIADQTHLLDIYQNTL